MDPPNKIIALTGPVGGGKTTLLKALAARLDAAAIECDSYERITEAPREAIVAWMQGGADANAFVIPQLVQDLEKLKRGEPVVEPLRQATILPKKCILLETNFGKEHAATARLIDLLIWLDTPLDLALARKTRQFTQIFLDRYQPAHHADCLRWLHGWLDNYTTFTRELLVIQRDRIRPTADVVVDGLQPVAALVETATRQIQRLLESQA